MKKGDKIATIIVLSILIISSIGVFSYKQHINSSHHIAVIKQDGKILKTIDLNKSKEKYQLKFPYKDSHFNIVEIENGKIRVSDADCPDKVCVKSGWISEPGQTTVCLPHKFMIKIEGKNAKFDEISK